MLTRIEATTPRTLAQARKTVDLNRQNDAEGMPPKEHKQSRARAQAMAKKLGIAAQVAAVCAG